MIEFIFTNIAKEQNLWAGSRSTKNSTGEAELRADFVARYNSTEEAKLRADIVARHSSTGEAELRADFVARTRQPALAYKTRRRDQAGRPTHNTPKRFLDIDWVNDLILRTFDASQYTI